MRMGIQLAAALAAFMIFSAVADAEDDAAVDITPLAPGVWLHRSYHTFDNGVRFSSNGLIVSDGDGLLLVDTAWGADKTRTLLRSIEAVIGKPVTAAIATHAHDDRVGGAAVLQAAGIPVYAHPETIRLTPLHDNPVPDVALPLALRPGSLAKLGPVDVVFAGAGHAPDNVVVWLREQEILFGGCLVRALADTKIGYIGDADVNAWPDTAAFLEARYAGARLVVPGHGRVGSAALLGHTRALAQELLTSQAAKAPE